MTLAGHVRPRSHTRTYTDFICIYNIYTDAYILYIYMVTSDTHTKTYKHTQIDK